MMKQKLSDWDFRNNDTNFMTHGIHLYPARMIPQIAENLIKNYGRENALILDPFCGSGGVLTEAVRANINCVGLDINPLACLISKIKSTPINPVKLAQEWADLRKIVGNDVARYRFKQIEPQIPEFGSSNITYWFKDYMIKELSIIKNSIDRVVNQTMKDFFYVCFSNAVRAVSGTRKGEFKLYRVTPDSWKNHNPDVFSTFTQKVELTIPMIGEFYEFVKKNHIHARSSVFQADTREIFEKGFSVEASDKLFEGSVDLIVTSPPYGDSHTTVAYGQFSRYSLVLMGYPYAKAVQIDKISLGGKRSDLSVNSKTLENVLSKIQSDKRRHEVQDFFVDLSKCMDKLYKLLSTNAHACFVLGNRTVNGIKVQSDQILIELGKDLGLSWNKTIHRNIPNKRMPRKNSPTNIAGKTVETITKESIVIFKK